MFAFSLILFLMVGFSFIASLLEGVLVGATVAEVEYLKRDFPRLGQLFESHQSRPDRSLSAILAVDSSATSIGSILLGPLIVANFGENLLVPISVAIAIGAFIFSDILPKTLGIYHRRRLLPWTAIPLHLFIWTMFPVAHVCSKVVDIFLPKKLSNDALSDEALILTARRGVRDGILTSIEGVMVEHTLTLDDVDVAAITQRKIFSIDGARTVGEIFRLFPEIPYGRIPVYEGERNNLVGIVRRRDLLKALANDEHDRPVASLVRKTVVIAHDVKISTALEILLQHFQQIAIIEDGGSHCPVGVLTLEDVFEYIIGRDIFEYDDLSNGSRSDARKLRLLQKKKVAETSPRPDGPAMDS
ncbi:MAG: CNNM domain-containing protein [Puniceicoccales bacterium]|jgi:CBS domain containing-hemolysin-like protein|nr:CNNM domain-containing protein [Puniceicoccales bacterium]